MTTAHVCEFVVIITNGTCINICGEEKLEIVDKVTMFTYMSSTMYICQGKLIIDYRFFKSICSRLHDCMIIIVMKKRIKIEIIN